MQNETTKIPVNRNLHPDPILAAENLTITAPARFWAKVDTTGELMHPKGCWLWTGQKDRSGAVLERGTGGTMMARKFSWLIHFGAVPEGKRIRNSCGNTLCVNPEHLQLGGAPEPMKLTPASQARVKEVCEITIDDPTGQDPTLPEGFSKTFRQRFFEKVQKTDSCWLWTGAVNSHGYGWIGKGKNEAGTVAAHIASWIMHFGPVPEGHDVLHDCPGGDNPSCVNPEHLWTGTASDNATDAVEKIHAKGEAHWLSTISAETVRAIREESRNGVPQKALAAKYGISQPHISRIVSGDRHTRII